MCRLLFFKGKGGFNSLASPCQESPVVPEVVAGGAPPPPPSPHTRHHLQLTLEEASLE